MWLEPRMPIPHARPPVSRHLLGLGLLLVTMASGYAASLVYERPSVVVPVQESVAPGFEAEATQGDPWADALAESARLNAVARRRAEFRDYSVTQNDDVRYFLDLFTRSRREVVETWMGRSGRYLAMIQEVFRSQGLPTDLAFTAMIESGCDPDQYGFAVGGDPWDDTERVSVPPSTDLRRLAADAGLSPEMLRGLNPTLVRGITPPGTPWEIRVPRGTSEGVLAALAPRPWIARADALRRP